MLHRYEVLMLTVPEVTQDEAKQLETELDKIVNSAKGTVLSFEKWGKYKLTYPVRSNEYGVYYLIRFATPVALTQKVDELFRIKLNNFVMRHVVTRLNDEGSIEYQRPKSLEEAPASRDMDTFLKENKMEGLLSSGDERRRDRGHRMAPQLEMEFDSGSAE